MRVSLPLLNIDKSKNPFGHRMNGPPITQLSFQAQNFSAKIAASDTDQGTYMAVSVKYCGQVKANEVNERVQWLMANAAVSRVFSQSNVHWYVGEFADKSTHNAFEACNLPAFYVAIQEVLSLYASWRTTGIALNASAHAEAIYEGKALPYEIPRLNLAGRDRTDSLLKILMQRGSSCTTSGRESVRDIKDELAYAGLSTADTSSDVDKNLELPDGQVNTIDAERSRCLEVLFRLSLMGKHSAIMGCDVCILCYNTVVSGFDMGQRPPPPMRRSKGPTASTRCGSVRKHAGARRGHRLSPRPAPLSGAQTDAHCCESNRQRTRLDSLNSESVTMRCGRCRSGTCSDPTGSLPGHLYRVALFCVGVIIT